MIRRIDHIGIAVSTLDERLDFWTGTLGLELGSVETVASEMVKAACVTVGESRLELLEATDDQSPIARHIQKRGEGIHHLTLQVSNLDDALERLDRAGVQLVGAAPRIGAGGHRVAFLHPRSTGGVLVELLERIESPKSLDAKSIGAGSAVLLYLRDPQEKMWGVLRRLDSSGVVAEGIDLGSFDDWVSQIERGEESVFGPSVIFIPMSRVEKILLDRSSGHLPSLADRFERRIGRTIQQVLDDL